MMNTLNDKLYLKEYFLENPGMMLAMVWKTGDNIGSRLLPTQWANGISITSGRWNTECGLDHGPIVFKCDGFRIMHL